LERCDRLLYAGSLVSPEVVALAPPQAERIDTADLALEEIVGLLADGYENGLFTVRLHSGDLSIYSALTEQVAGLAQRGIPVEIVPGVPAFAAAAAALGRELTVPGVGQTVILCRYRKRSTPVPGGERLEELAAHQATMAIHLGGHALEELEAILLPAYGPHVPAAVVAYASWPNQVVVEGRLGGIAAQARAAGVKRNAVLFVGRALGGEGLRSHLYSPKRLQGEAYG